MSRLDLVIFGATGYTGKRVVLELVRVLDTYPDVTWAVAGRSQSKLDQLMLDVSKKSGKNLIHIKTIIAQIRDEQSLKDMCGQARVVLNCCGPYRMYGEPVVKAAIETKSHLLDVSGEPQYMEMMQLRYSSLAREAGVLVVSACGFDSIPNDMGLMFLQQHFEGTLNSVESYLSSYIPPEFREAAKTGTIHYGTWESLVYSLAFAKELKSLRKQLYPDALPNLSPKLMPKSVIHRHNGRWCLPFPGADQSIVYRTQRHFHQEEKKRPVQFRPYVKMPGFLATIATCFGALLLYAMSLTKSTRKWLLDYPRLFSGGMVTRDGPKDEVAGNIHMKFELIGRGWQGEVNGSTPNKVMTAQITFKDAYYMTAVGLIYSAIAVLKQKDKMPQQGGVYTTGAAFHRTDLINNLIKDDVKFEMI